MHRELSLKVLLIALVSLAGCASSPIRPLMWLRSRPAQAQIAQSPSIGAEDVAVNSLSATPPRLPPGLELPPAPMQQSQTQPSAATEPHDLPNSNAVIPAGFR